MSAARPPRPFLVHWVVDTAVAFLAIVVVALFLDVSIWIIISVAVLAGALAAPLTQRAEERALAERDRRDTADGSLASEHDDDPGAPPPARPER